MSKKIVTIGIAVVLACVVFVGVCANLSFVNAETLSDEAYTSSDHLLNANGTTETKTIQNFADEVKAAANNDEVFDLEKVIPTKYLNSSTDITVNYCGAEYGYYFELDGNVLNLLLIDFVFDFEDNDENSNEYRFRVKPILQQAFRRTWEDDGYTWKKINRSIEFYVANPVFMSQIRNENELNCNDAGYDKFSDNGVIIQQSRINVGQVLYKTESDLVEQIGDMALDIVINVAVDMALNFVPHGNTIGTIADAVITLGEGINDIIESGRETILEQNNEVNIMTEQSKSAQRNNPELDGYSRVIANSMETEIVLSDDDNSYMENIVLLSDTNSRTRLNQYCEFEIVKKRPSYDSPEYVTTTDSDGSSQKLKMLASREKILFDDMQPVTNFDETSYVDGDELSVYMLPQGDKTVTFSPKYSGRYSFNIPQDVSFNIGSIEYTENTVYLDQGREYKLVLHNNSSDISQFRLKLDVAETVYDGDSVMLGINEDIVYKYVPAATGYYIVDTEDNVDVDVNSVALDPDLPVVYCQALVPIYVSFNNNTGALVSTDVFFNVPPSIDLQSDIQGEEGKRLYRYVNTYGKGIGLEITVADWALGDEAAVYNTEGETLGDNVVGDGMTRTFSLASGEACYVYVNFSTAKKFSFQISSEQWLWQFGDTIVTANTLTAPRGKIYDVYLYARASDGSLIALDTEYVVRGSGCNIVGNSMQIAFDADIGSQATIIPVAATSHILRINIVKGIEGNILFDKEGGSGGTSSVYAYHGQLPEAEAPSRTGYNFMGYYTAPDGEGIQYYDSEMNAKVEWTLTSDITLYAYWQNKVYEIYLESDMDGVPDSHIKINYGDPIPNREFWAPVNPGYQLLGYYQYPDGRGKQYCSVDWCNDEITADINGYDHYYRQYIVPVDGVTWNTDGDGTLYAKWELLACEYTYTCYDENSNVIREIKLNVTHNRIYEITPPEIPGYTFESVSCMYPETGQKDEDLAPNQYRFKLRIKNVFTKDEEIPAEVTGTVVEPFISLHYRKNACVAEGTLITLADGSRKAVELLTGNEQLLVWNLLTGQFDSAPILFIDRDPVKAYEVIELTFSDGTSVEVISEHAFWDCDLGKYVYLDSTASQYVGHSFHKQYVNADGTMGWREVKLTGVNVTQKTTSAHSPITYSHLCYYVNGMLSVPGGIDGMFNIFEVDKDTMKIDQAKMAEDIAEYGLYTYEEFSQLVPVSQQVFEAFNGSYLKIAVGKGMIDTETLIALAERYSAYLN